MAPTGVQQRPHAADEEEQRKARSHAPQAPPAALRASPLAAAALPRHRRAFARPLPGSRTTLEETAAAAGGMDVLFRRAASVVLGLSDRVASAAASWDPAQHKFFADGTGDLARLREHEADFLSRVLVNRRPPAVAVEWLTRRVSRRSGAVVRTGRFLSPLAHLLPPEARWARVQLVSPPPGAPPVRGLVLMFAATADQTFVLRRRLLAEPLLAQHGIASLLLMPAFYGARRPAAQTLHYTRTLTDFCLMTHSTIAEGWVLAEWARGLAQPGGEFAGARLGVTGVSMGGAMAAVVAALSLGPIAISPCLGTWTGAGVYTDGGLAPQVAWRKLAAERGGSAAAARAWVREVLEHNEIGALVDALSGVAGQGPRTLVMCNAVDDAYVAAAEAQHLFSVLAPTCTPSDAVHHWIAGGHVTSVLARAHTFVSVCVESFDLLDARLAANEAAELAAQGDDAAAAAQAEARAAAEADAARAQAAAAEAAAAAAAQSEGGGGAAAVQAAQAAAREDAEDAAALAELAAEGAPAAGGAAPPRARL